MGRYRQRPVRLNGGGGSGISTSGGTAVLLSAPLPNSGVFTSDPFDRDQSPANTSSARLIVTANASFTAKLQGSTDGGTWTDLLTYTVNSNAVDQNFTPGVRYVRWVITATAGGMTSMSAKVVFS